MTRVSCSIIEDLLPLYCDNICSEESKQMVEGHLRDCEHCAQMLRDLRAESKISLQDKKINEQEGAVLGKMARSWKKSLLKSFVKGITVAAVIFCVAFVAYYGLSVYQGSMVIPEQVEATGYRVSDTQMTFKLQPVDGYCGGTIKSTVTENGNLYIAIYRSVIKEDLEIGESEIMNYGFNQAQKGYAAVYYGTPDNCKLLWEQGQTLPFADNEISE